ncbi:hypothetical protein [Sinorhizobium meliloti]|uniref:hypothetical protein n=1 Tax=Rhizobium meliloti TaxID=382 RepID=UPI00035C921A|nr:hypothetical protein [Sinorhizobium meliloti]MDE3767586.1 hypothetical protein [Sinorhizobium meliloti]MDE3779781.1 hypothetical protein [Sinorhizobium meliloti]MDE3807406.1 hypothetical protein [Sinorhizobium meliloti]
MNDDIRVGILRYEAMVGLCDYENPDDAGQTARDRAQYGTEYAAPRGRNGAPCHSPAKVVRFLVEVCGFSYEDSLEAVIEDMRGWPSEPKSTVLDSQADAQDMMACYGNIIEALFDLKVVRMARKGDEAAQDFTWRVTRALTAMRRDVTTKTGRPVASAP